MNGFTASPTARLLPTVLALASVLSTGALAGTTPPEWMWLSPGADADVDTNLYLNDNTRRIAALDAQGNTFVASTAEASQSDFLTRKFGPDGSLLWTSRFDAGGVGDDVAVALAIDAVGDVFVTGRTQAGFPSQAAVVKYDGSTGDRLWVRKFVESPSGSVVPRAMAVDAAGDVVVTGALRFSFPGGDDYITVKYRGSDGAPAWTGLLDNAVRYDGPGSGSDGATSVALDDAGNIFVTGYSQATPGSGLSGAQFATIKYDSTSGAVLWTSLPGGAARYGPPAPAESLAVGLSVDGDGNVVVAGNSASRLATIKYDGTTGSVLWTGLPDGAAVHPEAFFSDGMGAIAIDAHDDIVITGNDGDALTTIKYSSATGATAWSSLPDGAAQSLIDGNATGRAIVVDESGDVLVAGEIGVGGASDVVVLKYSGVDGSIVWNGLPDGAAVFDGAGADDIGLDGARTLLVGADGDLLVVGLLLGELNHDLLLARLDGDDGSELWRADEGTDTKAPERFSCGVTSPESASVVDAGGNTYIAAMVQASVQPGVPPYAGATYKVDAEGQYLWRSRRAGTPAAISANCGVVLDQAGDVVEFGFVGDDFAARKLEAETGNEIWSQIHPESGVDRPAMGVIDAQGDITVTGTSTVSSSTKSNLVVRFHGDSGDLLWAVRRGNSSATQACCLVVEPGGDVFHAARASGPGATQILTLERLRAADGSLAWSTAIAVTTGTPIGLQRNAAGEIFMSSHAALGSEPATSLTIKFDPATGAELWRSVLAPGGNPARPWAITLDPDGNPVISGEILSTTRGLLTFKLSGATGQPLWNDRDGSAAIDNLGIGPDVAYAVQVGLDGLVWAGGFSYGPGQYETAIALLGYGQEDGFTRFRHTYSEPGHPGFRQAQALAIAPDGALRLTGSAGTSYGTRIFTQRLDPVHASEWPHLTSVVASAGVVLPATDPFDHVVRIEVANATGSITLTPTSSRADAVLTLDGIVVANGAASHALDLDVGFNRFALQASAFDVGAERTIFHAIEIVRARAAQSITLDAPSTRLLDAGAFSAMVAASSGLPVTLMSTSPAVCSVDETTVMPIALGSCVLLGTQAGDANHEPAAVEHTVNIVADLALFANGFE